jgi:hypothetical protein
MKEAVIAILPRGAVIWQAEGGPIRGSGGALWSYVPLSDRDRLAAESGRAVDLSGVVPLRADARAAAVPFGMGVVLLGPAERGSPSARWRTVSGCPSNAALRSWCAAAEVDAPWPPRALVAIDAGQTFPLILLVGPDGDLIRCDPSAAVRDQDERHPGRVRAAAGTPSGFGAVVFSSDALSRRDGRERA